jgi:hypothetical protein
MNKKWQIALNLINFLDVSCKSVSCSFYWAQHHYQTQSEQEFPSQQGAAWLELMYTSRVQQTQPSIGHVPLISSSVALPLKTYTSD